MKSFVVAIFIACFAVAFGEKVRYDNFRIYSLNVTNQEQLKALQELENPFERTKFLEPPTNVGQVADLLVPPHKFADVAGLFAAYGIENHIKTENLQELIDREQPSLMERSFGFGWTRYNDLNAIYNWLDQLLQEYPNVLTEYVYGKSYMGRPLRAVRVSHKKGNPTIFIESTIHAREWITAATATYFLNELLTSDKPEIRYLANNFDWVIVPVMNVDGYQYSHTTDRMWRKTRKPSSRFGCVGADPNRNFDSFHGYVGASTNPCSDIYPGPHAFSEPETLALARFVQSLDVKLYLTFHSYSQVLLFPMGHTKQRVPNYNDLLRIGTKTIQAISKRYGTTYRVGNVVEILYAASGGSDDFMYSKLHIPLTYTFEFRDTGRYGFDLPANQIVPNALETIDGLVAMVKEAKNLKYL